jgi:nucleotide-binding universal stress UspA family protein
MHLLLGVGDADDGLRALEETVARARAAGDEVTVAVYSTDETSTDAVRAAVRDRLDDLEFDAAIETIEDDPTGRLVELSETADIDRIVLPGGERSPLGKIRLDRVAEFVLLNATTTVTLLR